MSRSFDAVFSLADKPALTVLSFSEQHTLGVPCEVTVNFLFDDYQDVEDLVGQQALLQFACSGAPSRVFAGIVESASIEGSSLANMVKRTFQYEVRVVSLARLLERSQQTRIFQALDVKGIVTKVLEGNGISSEHQQWKTTGKYPVRDYCVQYAESDLAFVSRLLEEEGIYFGSRFDPDKGEILFFADDSTAAAAIDGDSTVPFVRSSNLHVVNDHVTSVGAHQRVVSDKFTLRDFNFEAPLLDMTCSATDGGGTLEVYDYPGGYFQKAEGTRLAQTRLEAELATRKTLKVDAECTRLSVGSKFKLEGTGGLEADDTYFIVAVRHEFEQAEGDRAATYVARAELLPAAVKYRPPRVTPRPVIEGPQTARIVCPAGAKSEEIHTDAHGRVKVKFPWDLGPDEDDKATFWMRTSQLQTSGSMMLPRVDWEVIVEYLEGNPDRPIVSGRTYNAECPVPYKLPEGKTRTAIKTVTTPGGGGSNEIRFEDAAGAEEIMIHSHKDTNITVANNKKKNVGNNETQNVKVDSTMSVGANQTVAITKGSQNQIGAKQAIAINGNRTVGVNAVTTLNVAGNAKTEVAGNQMEMDGNPLQALLALAVERAAEVATAQAKQALSHVEGAVQGKLDQVMGPVKTLTDKAGAVGEKMKSVGNGDLAAVGGVLAGIGGLPSAVGLANAFKGGGEGGDGQGGAPKATQESAGAMLDAAANNAIQKGIAAGKSALSSALGLDGGGGGGPGGGDNVDGPEGKVEGVDQTDRTKGPGHTTAKVGKTFKETVGVAQVTAALNGVITNVGKDTTRNVGAAQVTMAYGDIEEAVAGSKTETALGLIVVAKGDESEAVKGARTSMVGGAILDMVSGDRSVSAEAAATFIGAFHKIEAESSITFKCGASSLVIDGSGVTMQSMAIMFMGAKQQHPKAVGEGG